MNTISPSAADVARLASRVDALTDGLNFERAQARQTQAHINEVNDRLNAMQKEPVPPHALYRLTALETTVSALQEAVGDLCAHVSELRAQIQEVTNV